ncbi:uncharacterized protein LOC143171543 [Aptenodytes patagonicus]|uniref:uncharacterized protein LOC143171543 n=1 Tax=Aptenodytes patagonicus TaxID=9234 RepID=UPI003F9F6D6B
MRGNMAARMALLWKRKLPACVSCGQSSRQSAFSRHFWGGKYHVAEAKPGTLLPRAPQTRNRCRPPFGEGRLLRKQELLGIPAHPKCSVLSTPLSIGAEPAGPRSQTQLTVSSEQPAGDAGTSGGWPDVARRWEGPVPRPPRCQHSCRARDGSSSSPRTREASSESGYLFPRAPPKPPVRTVPPGTQPSQPACPGSDAAPVRPTSALRKNQPQVLVDKAPGSGSSGEANAVMESGKRNADLDEWDAKIRKLTEEFEESDAELEECDTENEIGEYRRLIFVTSTLVREFLV